MNLCKQILRSPYFYIYVFTNYGIWLIWDKTFVPYRNSYDVVGALSNLHYNPIANILRFGIAIFLPPILCLGYWALLKQPDSVLRKRIFATILIVLSLFVLVAGAIMQSSTTGTNDKYTYGGPYNDTLVDTFHEGETLGTAVSYEQKDQVPYRDFVFVHGVFQDPVRTQLAFKLFGRSIGAERAFASILTIITFVMLYGLLLVLFRGNLVNAAIVSIATSLLLLPVLGDTLPFLKDILISIQIPSLDFETILFLLAAVLGIRAIQSENHTKTWLYSLALGFITFAGFANAIDRALFLLGVAAVWLLMVVILLPFKAFLKVIAVPFALGSIAGIGVLGVALKGDYKDFLSFILHISQYKEYLDGYIFSRPTVAQGIVLATLSISVTAAGAAIIRHLSAKELKLTNKFTMQNARKIKHVLAVLVRNYSTEVLLFCTALFFLRSAIGRADYGHFAYSIFWTYLFVWYIALNYWNKRIVKASTVVNYLVMLLMIFTTTYFAVAVKNVHLSKNTFPIHIPDSYLIRPDYKDTADYLKSHLKGNESFITLTSEASWYYFVDKPSPVRYPVVWFAGADYARQELAKDLSTNKNIKYVITNNNWTSDIDFVPTNERLPEVYSVLQQYFTPDKGIGQQTLWKRNGN